MTAACSCRATPSPSRRPITILRLPPSSNPFEDESILPPFFDITASNSLGTHYLTAGIKAIVGFCVEEEVLNSLNEPAIAHIAATEPGHPGGFELLDAATAAQYNSLGLTDCAQLPTSFGSLLHGGWPKLKSYAGAALQSMLLPEALAAATLAKGGLGGLASSLSPFGIADRAPDEEVGDAVPAGPAVQQRDHSHDDHAPSATDER